MNHFDLTDIVIAVVSGIVIGGGFVAAAYEVWLSIGRREVEKELKVVGKSDAK